MKRYLLYLLIVVLLCAGCSVKDGGGISDNPDASLETSQGDNFADPTDLQTTSSEIIPEPSANETATSEDTTEPVADTAEPSDEIPTDPQEPVTEIGDYILDGTKLIGYVGEDTALTLPDEVTSIAAYAFRDAPSGAQITNLHLGAKVTEIEAGAFTGMHSLCTFTVDAQNPQFYAYEDHTLVSLDGTLYMGFGIDFQDIISSLELDWIENFAIVDKIIIGGGEIFVCHKSDKLFVSLVRANGQNVVFEKNIQITGNHDIYIQETNQGYVFSDKYNNVADTWLLTRDHVFVFEDGLTEEQRNEHKSHQIADYNYSLYSLFVGKDGTLGYYRILSKYANNNQYVYNGLLYCVSKDEFACELGSVEINGSSLKFNCEKIFTAEERYSDEFLETIYIHGSNYSLDEQFLLYLEYESSDYVTLDELLTANAEKYERGY